MSRQKSLHTKARITLEVSIAIRERIESIRQRTGAESATEVIRRALALYDTVLTAGSRIRIGNKDYFLPKDIV